MSERSSSSNPFASYLDGNYRGRFDAVVAKAGVKVVRYGRKQPVMNAHCERVVRTNKDEVLIHFFRFGEAHLRHLLDEATDYYHHDRPPRFGQSVNQLPTAAGG